jgi:hypothetical protein
MTVLRSLRSHQDDGEASLLRMTQKSKKSLREKISVRILRDDVCGIFLAPHVERKTRDAFLAVRCSGG